MPEPLAVATPVAVIGAGAMGAGIAELAARAGHPVLLFDQEAQAMTAALERIARSLQRLVDRGRLDAGARARTVERITVCPSLHGLQAAGLAIEAVAEDLDAKRALLNDLEQLLDARAILASNTSSLSITALAAGLERPERVVGMHFFNPAPVMALVEIVRGLATSDEVVATVRATAEAWGKTPVVVRSTPGFIVNRIARPFYGEALRALAERAGDPATIDAVARDAGGFRMGPFELMDLIGLDVNLAVSRSIHAAFSGDPRYTPSLLQEEMVAAGRLGRKSGRGFYDHAADAAPSAPALAPAGPRPTRIVAEGDLGIAEPLAKRIRDAGIEVERHSGEGLIRLGGLRLALTDGRSATEWAYMLDAPVVLFDLALDFATTPRLALAPADQASERDRAAAAGLFQAAGIEVAMIDDLPGLVVMRTLCMLANEAAEVVHTGTASVDAVDTAMRLGVNYPKGPLAWADELGPKRVLEVLDHLARVYGEDRYRASPLLRRKVHAARPFHG